MKPEARETGSSRDRWQVRLARRTACFADGTRHWIAALRRTGRSIGPLALALRVLRVLLAGIAGAAAIFVVVVVLVLNEKPTLSRHHLVEWRESDFGRNELVDFGDYLEREEALFEAVEQSGVYRPRGNDSLVVDRFRRGSLADPHEWNRNWNRTFHWSHESPRCAVLLLHGMSDSPYSMRAIGETVHRAGASVIGLRLPGHGTTPSALVSVRWQEMAEAVRLAAGHLAGESGGAPLHIVGYSNGGALAVHYAQRSLLEPGRVRPASVVLVSPAVGVGRIASMAAWQGRLGRWLGLEKLEWNAVSPEYDPFKYASFPVNAGDQVYRLTVEIAEGFDRLEEAERLDAFPPVLAFQSALDATVSTPALIEGLYGRLPENGHELVLFGLNRIEPLEWILRDDPRDELVGLIRSTEMNFTIRHLANRTASGPEVEVRTYERGREIGRESLDGMRWPNRVYSLSHVSLPFTPGDPLYGPAPPEEAGSRNYRIGDLHLRGEKGGLQVSEVDQLRLRWNPFYPYLERRLLDFLGLDPVGDDPRPD